MKKILLILVTYLLTIVYSNAGVVVGNYYVDAGGASTICSGCGTCAGCSAYDLVCEDWETDNGCTWADDDAAGTIDHAASPSGSWSCASTYVTDITHSSDTTGDCYTYIDLSAFPTDVDNYINVYFKLVDDGAMSAFNNANILWLDDTSDPYLSPAYMIVYEYGTEQWELQFKSYDDGNSGTTVDNNYAITLGTEYLITFRFYYGTGSDDDEVEFYINSVSQGSVTGMDLKSNAQYLILGDTAVATSTYNMHYQFGPVIGDDDTNPDGCP